MRCRIFDGYELSGTTYDSFISLDKYTPGLEYYIRFRNEDHVQADGIWFYNN